MLYQESVEMNEFVELVRLGLAYNPESGNYFLIPFNYPADSWEYYEGEERTGGVWTPSEVHAISTIKDNILRLLPQDEGDEMVDMECGLQFEKRPDGTWTFSFDKGVFSPAQCEVLARIEELTK